MLRTPRIDSQDNSNFDIQIEIDMNKSMDKSSDSSISSTFSQQEVSKGPE